MSEKSEINWPAFQLEMMERAIKICKKGTLSDGEKFKSISVSTTIYKLLRSNIVHLPKNRPVIYHGIRVKNKKNLLDNEIEFGGISHA